MTHTNRPTVLTAVFIAILSSANLAPTPALAQPATAVQPANSPAPKERIAAIKKSFAVSQAALRKYEWIETTVTTLKGEEKARKESRCYYGSEGGIQKVPVSATPEEKPGRGIRGRIKEQKKEELADYMEQAAALVHSYLPPDAEKIQKCADAGKVTIHILEPEKRAKVEFRDYLQAGDTLGVEIDLANNTILGVNIATALGKDADPITLAIAFGKFEDGTIYTATSTLDAKAKKVAVVVTNSGYRKTGT